MKRFIENIQAAITFDDTCDMSMFVKTRWFQMTTPVTWRSASPFVFGIRVFVKN